MDIVSRIKTFLNVNGIANSIFADKCDIPRPTLSQLLNGRNKKVSNEVIEKIHIAYPEISMMWLMFGEGEMQDDISQNRTNSQNSLFSENEEFFEESVDGLKDENVKESNSVADALQLLSKNISKNNSHEMQDEGNSKQIVNIMVFYSDNSFESFVPNK